MLMLQLSHEWSILNCEPDRSEEGLGMGLTGVPRLSGGQEQVIEASLLVDAW